MGSHIRTRRLSDTVGERWFWCIEGHQITTTGGWVRLQARTDLRKQLCCGWRLGLAAVGEGAAGVLTTGASTTTYSVRKSVFQIIVTIVQSSGVYALVYSSFRLHV
jgi:hypothetical protein